MSQQQKDIVSDLYRVILKTDNSPYIFYKTEGNEIRIVVVIKDNTDLLEQKIYQAEWNILDKYPKVKVDVRVIPKYNLPLYRLIPEGYVKYNPVQ